jgi:hypothetical protein
LDHPICRKDTFRPYPKCKAEIKFVSVLLTHLDKKHELSHVCCKDRIRYFISGLHPGRIEVVPKTGDWITINRLWDVERCPCLSCDYFHNTYHNVEIHAKVHKEMHANMEVLGWFWGSISSGRTVHAPASRAEIESLPFITVYLHSVQPSESETDQIRFDCIAFYKIIFPFWRLEFVKSLFVMEYDQRVIIRFLWNDAIDANHITARLQG